MNRSPFLLPAMLLCLSVAPLAHAQTTEAPAQDSTPAENPDPALADLQLGAEVEDAPGTQYVAETFTDWQMTCVRSGLEADPCQMYQVLKDKDGNAVSEVTLFNLPAEAGQVALGGTIVTPLETLLPAQITLRVDAAKAKVYPFTLCAPVGCISRVGFTQAELDAFRRGNKATITIVHALNPEQPIPLDMSLKGFTAAYDAVVKANAAADAAIAKAQAEQPQPPASGN